MMKMPEQLERMMFGFIESQVLFVCDEIKLFDYLINHGPRTPEEISQYLLLPSSSLERLLIVATCMRLLEKNNNRYQLREEWIPFLTSTNLDYCGKKFSHYWKNSYKIFEHLISALKDNAPQWNKINKKNNDIVMESVYCDSIYRNKESTEDFLETMWASGYKDSIDLCKKYSFKKYKKLVDLGGATGSFAIAALLENPALQAEIMDYVQVKSYAEKIFREYHLTERAFFYAGDIFKDPLRQADIYSIGYVLSDWPESYCLSLIQKIYDSLPENGLIVILEKFFYEDKSGPYLTAILNLTMLLEMHGTHRSIPEYIKWLEEVGFSDFQTVYSAGEKHMLIGKKCKAKR